MLASVDTPLIMSTLSIMQCFTRCVINLLNCWQSFIASNYPTILLSHLNYCMLPYDPTYLLLPISLHPFTCCHLVNEFSTFITAYLLYCQTWLLMWSLIMSNLSKRDWNLFGWRICKHSLVTVLLSLLMNDDDDDSLPILFIFGCR